MDAILSKVRPSHKKVHHFLDSMDFGISFAYEFVFFLYKLKLWLTSLSFLIMQCTCGFTIIKSCGDMVFNAQVVKSLVVSTKCLLILFPIFSAWLKAIDKSIHYFEASQGFHLVCGVDYVWIESSPLPLSLPQSGLSFGPFCFVRHWYHEGIWWLVLKDNGARYFLVEQKKAIRLFTSIGDDLLGKC